MKKQCAVFCKPQPAGSSDTTFRYNGRTWFVIARYSDGCITGLGDDGVKLTLPERLKEPVSIRRPRSTTYPDLSVFVTSQP